MAGNFKIIEMGPVVRAMGNLRSSIFSPPKSTIEMGTNLFPDPLQPVTPIGPSNAAPLRWPMNWGQNLQFTPREDLEFSANALRKLATYPLVRICIENTKDMLCRMPHRVQLVPLLGETMKDRVERAKSDQTLIKLNQMIDRPNPQENFEDFIRNVIEDMLVIDAASIFNVRKNGTGDVTEFRWVEGASITRLVEQHGWTPAPPQPAYQQTYQGYPRLDLTTDQLTYRPRNIVPRISQASFLYGMSPVEQVAGEIQIGVARMKFVYDFYAEGSIPGGIIFAPIGTPADKIREAQQWLDSDLAGQLAKRRRLQIVQGFQQEGKNEQLAFPKEPQLADLFDEVHIRKICFALGTSPQRLMRSMNRASAETVQEAAEQEGSLPFMNWLKSLLDYKIQIVLKQPKYEFMFDPRHELDAKKQAEADDIDIKGGVYTRNEKRIARGDDPRDEKEADLLMVTTANGLVPVDYNPGETSLLQAKNKQNGTPSNSSNSTQKTNGHTTWPVCIKHTDYPRAYCKDCFTVETKKKESVQTV